MGALAVKQPPPSPELPLPLPHPARPSCPSTEPIANTVPIPVLSPPLLEFHLHSCGVLDPPLPRCVWCPRLRAPREGKGRDSPIIVNSNACARMYVWARSGVADVACAFVCPCVCASAEGCAVCSTYVRVSRFRLFMHVVMLCRNVSSMCGVALGVLAYVGVCGGLWCVVGSSECRRVPVWCASSARSGNIINMCHGIVPLPGTRILA